MIKIKETDYIGKGNFQKCYMHPENKNLCIKIKIDENCKNIRVERELLYYEKIQSKKLKKIDYSFFAKYHGAVKTNLGEGFIYELIRDEVTNKVSKTLFDYLEMKNSPISDKVFVSELKKLKRAMIANDIIARDLTGKNICCKILSNNTIQLIIIDGIGHNEFFPFVDWFSFAAKIKINRVYKKKKLNSMQEHRKFYELKNN